MEGSSKKTSNLKEIRGHVKAAVNLPKIVEMFSAEVHFFAGTDREK